MKVLTLDIGGSSIKYAIIDENCHLSKQNKKPTPLNDIGSLWQTLDDIVEGCDETFDGIAISMPGVIDSQKGFAYTGGALRYIENCYFAKEITNRYKVPAWIGNDARCASLAEVGYGCLNDVNDAFVTILGTGIGGCIIKDRKVHYGKHFASGEVSSLLTDINIPFEPSTQWWAVNGSLGLLKEVQKATNINEQWTGEEIFAMANDGNEQIIKGIDNFAKNIAVQLFNIQALLDVEKIAIGGGISAQPLLIELIKKNCDQLFKMPYIPIKAPEIVACKFLNDANMIGAYYQWCQCYCK
ncbi:MAG: ROK family protein [Erysipelotrichaceae bacterium]|nr:ROK family protein [Erysipelotrichaceae bacterium]